MQWNMEEETKDEVSPCLPGSDDFLRSLIQPTLNKGPIQAMD